MRWFVVVVGLAGGAATAAACGLDDEGSVDGPGPDGAPSARRDGSAGEYTPELEGGPALPPPPDGQCPAASAAACATPPAGWGFVGFHANRDAPCDEGFVQSDGIAGPIAGSVTCGDCQAASCTVLSPATCSAGAMTAVQFDTGAAPLCNMPVADVAVSGACSTTVPGAPTVRHLRATPPVAAFGSCSLGSVASSKLQGLQIRTCVPRDASCANALCEAGSECIVAPGELACPAGSYTVRRVVGDEAGVACGACGCRVEATCSGTLSFFNTANCTGDEDSVPVNRACGTIARESDDESYGSFKYTGKATLQRCVAPNSGAAATATLRGNVRTICCRAP